MKPLRFLVSAPDPSACNSFAGNPGRVLGPSRSGKDWGISLGRERG